MTRRMYGSVQNRFEENRMLVDEIRVGTGMTEYMWSDRHPYEVVGVKDQKHVQVRRLGYKYIGTQFADNQWELFQDPAQPIRNMVKRGDYWYWQHADGTRTRVNVTFGKAEKYHDYEF